ncbi:MAG: prepilin-type N-terminal cleavage/methylation domain-containing protein [Nitrospinota bacterium]
MSDNNTAIKGFTLIEILVSVAIIAIAFTTLVGLHIRSLEMGAAAADISVASIVAKEQIERVRMGTVSIQFDTKAEKDSEHPGFFWDITSFGTLLPGVKEVQVTVYKKREGTTKEVLITLSTYLLK